MKKISVILFNLGGPDSTEAIKPFLFNLFNDPAIIGLPSVLRYAVARFVSNKREKLAKKIYNLIGGRSPILEKTYEQADRLRFQLNKEKEQYSVFVCMRYWDPLVQEVVCNVLKEDPDEIILLPLYPQFSSTTTGSSFLSWDREFSKQRKKILTKKICCYPAEEFFIKAHIEEIKKTLKTIEKKEKNLKNTRVLFSAHGLPEKTIKKGDPYQHQVGLTVKKIINKINFEHMDYSICFQSKVGPLKWLEPATQQKIIEASKEGKTIVIVPIAFVSEHSETLVELDIEYKRIAEKHGCNSYYRIPALGINENYIKSLLGLILSSQNKDSFLNERICPNEFKRCYQEDHY